MQTTVTCPKCGGENSMINVTCDLCDASLAEASAIADVGGMAKAHWMLLSVGLTWLILVLGTLSPLHRFVAPLLAVFYGPLLASYWATQSVVWRSSLGGAIGTVLGILTIFLLSSANTAVLRLFDDGDGGPSFLFVLVVGPLVILPSLLPISLMGATVGDRLSEQRRARRAAEIENVGRVDPGSVKL